MTSRRLLSAFAAVSILLLLPSRADAYIDPGTGSYVLQLLLAGILGALFALKVFWHRTLQFFKHLFSRREKLRYR